MSVSRLLTKPLFALAAAGVAGLLAAAPAQAVTEAEAEQIFLEYQRAIAAAESCYDVKYSQDEFKQMMVVINAAVENKIGTKRLNLVHQAKGEVSRMLPSQTCKGAKIVSLLELFERDLRPQLTQ
jgi:hypothetical protein